MSVLSGADLYLHYKHGINLWGYREPAVGKKQFGEKCVAVLGGSTTWGFGLQAGQDFPAQLQRLLSNDNNGNIKVLNLGANNEGRRMVDLRDQTLCWDGMHLTEEGNRRIAAALREPVLEILR